MEDWQDAWRRDCATVGLAATSTDLGEIKRAYAKTLRKTRPEDDAQAYQALREAYERVVALARQEAQDAAGGERSTSPGRVDVAAPDQARPDAPSDAVPMPTTSHGTADRSEAQTLCLWLQTRIDDVPSALPQRWDALRREALTAALPEFRERLAQLPLPEMPEASVRFADLLLRHADIAPAELVHLLHGHFAWTGDFRAERLLGLERTAALGDLLQRELTNHPVPLADPALQREYGPLGSLAAWISSPRLLDRLRARIAIVAMGHGLDVQLRDADEALLRQIGVPFRAQREILEMLKITNIVVWLLMTLSIVGVLYAAKGQSPLDFGPAMAIAVMGAILPLVLFVAYIAINFCWALINITPAKRWVHAWLPKYGGWLAIVGFVAAGVLARQAGMEGGDGQHDRLMAAQIVALTSVMLAISHWSVFLANGIAWLVAALPLMLLAPPSEMVPIVRDMPPVPALWLGIAAAWATLGGRVLTDDFYRPQPERTLRPEWPRGGVVALLLMGTIGLPTGLGWLAFFGGHRLIIGALMLAATAAAAAPAGKWQLIAGVGAFYLALALLIAAQHIGWRAGRRLMSRRPGATP